MGKDFIVLIENNYNLKDAYKKLFSGDYEVLESSEEKFFNRIPSVKEILNIEVGSLGTKESILRLKNNGYVVINKTINLNEVKKDCFF